MWAFLYNAYCPQLKFKPLDLLSFSITCALFAQEGTGGDVRPHPHIGLATVTYLYSGAIMHRDSLGYIQRIEPGDINLMIAGSGIVHLERIPADIRREQIAVEGIQLWLALSAQQEEREPTFEHYPADALPTLGFDGVSMQILIGQFLGLASPVITDTPTFQIDLKMAAGARLKLPPDYPERGIYLTAGELEIDGSSIQVGQLAVLTPDQTVLLYANAPTRIMLIGGAPLDAKRFIYWNFVAQTRERIEKAKADCGFKDGLSRFPEKPNLFRLRGINGLKFYLPPCRRIIAP